MERKVGRGGELKWRNRMEWNGMGWKNVGMAWDGMGWDGIRAKRKYD